MASQNAIERVLFVSPLVHVYMIPPLSSSRGHVASNWTKPPAQEIFVDQTQRISPRLRILESSPISADTNITGSSSSSSNITITIFLEAPSSGELFAACPYLNPNVVMQAVDSSRFFAITVVDSGRKATLGIGFEERSDAFDFGVTLQEVRKTLQWDSGTDRTGGLGATGGRRDGAEIGILSARSAFKKDWSLKEGETLHIEVPKSIKRGSNSGNESSDNDGERGPTKILDSGSSGLSGLLLPPPPSAAEVKEERRKSREVIDEAKKKALADLGFDDGEFGEFQ